MSCANFNSPYQAEKRRTAENADNQNLESIKKPIDYSDMGK